MYKNDTLSPEMIKKIIEALSQGDRVELIPVKDGVKVVREKRTEIKVK